MQAEIEAMSMNSNMHQVSVREKTLLKTYLQVELNEYFQEQMDSKLFEGVDEADKSKFIGDFFHFTKCRFQDCGSLVQTGSTINASNPSGKYSKVREDKINMVNWGSGKGNFVPSHNANDASYVQTEATNPSGKDSKARED